MYEPEMPSIPDLTRHDEDDLISGDNWGFWRYLMDEPGLGIVACDDGGHILDANDTGALLCTGRPRDQIVGSLLEDLHGMDLTKEVLESMARVHRSQKRGLQRLVWGGRQLVITHHPLGMGRTGRQMLYVLRHVWGPLSKIELAADQFCQIETQFVDFGQLDVLSDRELEVLALIGEGHSLGEIAEDLNRSIKTIDSHRSSISRKLRVSGRTSLARLALRAGLRRTDVKNRRLRTVHCCSPAQS